MIKKSLSPRLCVFVTLLLLSLPGCGSLDLKSHWTGGNVAIDGGNRKWNGILTPVGTAGTSVGLLNDQEFIYVGLVTTNHDLQRQIMRQGITFWFDREGGKEKRFGIHYPLGSGDRGSFQNEQESGSQNYQPRQASQGADAELDIFGPGKDDHARMTKAQAGGIEAFYKISNDTLVYDLKVPLSDNGHHPFAIDAKSAAVIGAGLETSGHSAVRSPDNSGESEGGRGGDRGGEMGGGRGMGGRERRGGGGNGGGRSKESGQSEPLSVWAQVQLAVADSTSR